jgi:large subunit ribosomal protein L29
MKTKEKKELFGKSIGELMNLLKEAKEALFNLRLENAQNKLKNKRSIFNKRKEIARIKTAITGKELSNNA